MIFVFLVAAFSALLTFALSLLPGSDFLPLPDAAISALEGAGGVGGWLLGVAGADVKEALLTMLPLVVAVKATAIGWHVLRNWRPPVIGKYV